MGRRFFRDCDPNRHLPTLEVDVLLVIEHGVPRDRLQVEGYVFQFFYIYSGGEVTDPLI